MLMGLRKKSPRKETVCSLKERFTVGNSKCGSIYEQRFLRPRIPSTEIMSSFKIITDLQHEDIVRAAPFAPVSFRIYTEIEGTAFPTQDWYDFGIVMLGWWAEEVNALEDGRLTTATLRFMEGPYELRVTAHTRNRWSLFAQERGTTLITVLESQLGQKVVVEEVRRAIRELLSLCKLYGYWPDDCGALSLAIREGADKGVRAVQARADHS